MNEQLYTVRVRICGEDTFLPERPPHRAAFAKDAARYPLDGALAALLLLTEKWPERRPPASFHIEPVMP